MTLLVPNRGGSCSNFVNKDSPRCPRISRKKLRGGKREGKWLGAYLVGGFMIRWRIDPLF